MLQEKTPQGVNDCEKLSNSPKLTKLELISLMFLPPNATACLQPCDKGIIKNLKVKYCRVVTKRLIENIEKNKPYEINVLDAMTMLRSAWTPVSAHTIANCFHKAGFLLTSCKANENVTPSSLNTEISDDDDEDDDNIPLTRLFNTKANSVTFVEYMCQLMML